MSLVVLCAENTACAQSIRDEFLLGSPVFGREPLDLKPIGINYGSFFISPQFEAETSYNDNIFLEDENERGDLALTLTPSLTVVKRYGDSDVEFEVQGLLKRYNSETSENLDLYTLSLSGDHALSRSAGLLYQGSLKRDTIDRSQPGDSRFTTQPISKDEKEVGVGFYKTFNRLNVSLLGTARRVTFENGISRATGLPVIFEGRNRNVRRLQMDATYDVPRGSGGTSDHQLFSSVSYQDQSFDRGILAPGDPVADNEEVGILAGFQTRYKGILFGKLGVGFFSREFKDSETVNKIDFDAVFAYNLTPKLTLNFSGGRSIEDDNSLTTGFVQTQASLGFDYELLHNWYTGATVQYKTQDFLGDQTGRDDNVLENEIYMRYLHSPYFFSKLSFEHNQKDSNAAGADYDQNIFMYSLTGRL